MRLWPIASGLVVVGLCATAFAMVVRSDPHERAQVSASDSDAPKSQLRDAPHDPDAETVTRQAALKRRRLMVEN